MVRKLAAALLGVGVFIPGLANALGLGEIKLNSALSEPLDAEIELVQVRELTATEILPSMASQEDFKSAGVERYQGLSDIKFEVIIGDKGRSYLKVRSRKPIKEPFLNFLVEVNWPAGRLLREYTMLLDPPIYSAQKAQPVRQAQAAPAAQKPVQPRQQAPKPSYTPSSQPSYDSGAGGESHTISSNDSLWSIAKNLKPSDSVSMQQTMIALQRYNPDAFIDGNINLLRRGQVLRAPSEAEAQEISSREAIEMVAEQNRLWRERLTGKKGGAAPEAQQMDLSGRTADRKPAPSRSSNEGRLKLLAGADGSADSGQGGSDAGNGAMRSQLAQAEENIDKFKLENDDLKVKMSDLEDQLKTSEKVLSLKDQQIAALQAKLAELDREAKAVDAASKKTPPVAETAPPSSIEPLNADIEEPVVAKPDVAEPAQDVDFNYQEETPVPVVEEPEASSPGLVVEDEIEPVVQQPVVEPKPEPVPQPAPAAQQDMLTEIMSNPLYLGLGGGAIVLMLVAGLMLARRKKQEEAFDEGIDENFQLPDNNANDLQDEMDIDLNDSVEDVFAQEEDEAPVEETVPQTADVLGEADIYIAYGRYPQAIEMLQKAAQKEPNRADIRMKLCEVCADAKEPGTFMTHYNALKALGATAMLAKADELRARVVPEDDFEQAFAEEALSEPVDDEAESFDFDIADDDSDATIIASSELDQESDTGLDFDLDDIEDTGASFVPAAAPVETTDEGGLDFDLDDMDGDDAVPLIVEATDELMPSSEGSLDFDLDMDEADPFKPAETLDSEDSDTLDFDTEFSLDEVESTPVSASNATVAFDEDLSLDFDQMETAADAPAVADNNMDFDLDFDVESSAEPVRKAESLEPDAFDASDDRTMAFTPARGADTDSSDDNLLDSASAAQLADELDFDVALDTTSDEDATIQAPAFDSSSFSAPSRPAANDLAGSGEDELDFLSDADETSTKLDLARAYIDMGDRDGARDILDEVLIEGSDNQKQEAKDLLTRLES